MFAAKKRLEHQIEETDEMIVLSHSTITANAHTPADNESAGKSGLELC